MLTKEKILALVAALVAIITLASLRAPTVEAVQPVPAEEQARSYRAVSSTPRLSPEEPFKIKRDPFRTQDPWQPAAPALLAVPSGSRWPRAAPGGLTPLPTTPRDRLLLPRDPQQVKNETDGEEEGQ